MLGFKSWVCSFLLLLFCVAIPVQANELWTPIPASTQYKNNSAEIAARETTQNKPFYRKKNGAQFLLDKSRFKSLLSASVKNLQSRGKAETTSAQSNDRREDEVSINKNKKPHKSRGVSFKGFKQAPELVLPIPMNDASIFELGLVKNKLLPESLKSQFPDIQSYSVVANDDIAGGRVTISADRLDAMIQTTSGEVVFVDRLLDSESVNSDAYVSYLKSKQYYSGKAFSCGARSFSQPIQTEIDRIMRLRLADITPPGLITYRIAVVTTGEYTAKHGGTVEGAMAAIATTLNRVNQVLGQDLGIQLQLVENNYLLINIDAESDPFNASTSMDLVLQNQSFIDSVIGNTSYDIGHLFTTSGGGLAAIASACHQYNKAKGVSGVSNPVSDSFDLDFVAHEIGHQLGATHTFNSSQGLCSGNTREAITAFEPGSGSTIMSYAGYCGLDNLQSHADAMYHIGNIKQIRNYTSHDKGSACGQRQVNANKPPVSNAGQNYIIPSRTPFELAGTAQDPDGDNLLHNWEQLDAGDASQENEDKGNNALFRVNMPSNKRNRIFPVLSNLLGDNSIRGETLPVRERTMRFSFVSQDGFNPAQSDEMLITVKRTGSRFALNLPKSQYTLGESYPIYWNVANTDKSPINCSTVDISLSTNRASSFDIPLGKNIPNTGEAQIIVPATADVTTQGRFKIKCSNNIFFAISSRNFVLTEKNHAVTYQHGDEDQPESNLSDVDLNTSSTAGNTPVVITEPNENSAGGAVSGFYILLMLLFSLLDFRVKTLKLNSGVL